MENIKQRNSSYSAKYYENNKELILERRKSLYEDHKNKVFNHYGDKCLCCGETIKLFLTVDHINNDGYLHRKQVGRSSHNNIYGWLVRNNFPNDFQILCMNCNQGKHRNNGICPHQEGSTIIESTDLSVKRVE